MKLTDAQRRRIQSVRRKTEARRGWRSCDEEGVTAVNRARIADRDARKET